MMTLSEYLNESVELPKTGFSEMVALTDVGKFFESRFPEAKYRGYVKAIQKLANAIFEDVEIIGQVILKCEGKGFLKIPYEVINKIDEIKETAPKLFDISKKGNKRIIKIGNRKIFETGSGSVGQKKLSPVIHENLTCLYFNNRDDWGNVGNGKEPPTKLAGTLMINLNIDKIWVKSFMQQVLTIDSYLSSLGITESLRAVRIDSNIDNRDMVYNGIYDGNVPDKDLLELDKIVLEKYNTIIKRFKLPGVKRETIDKSDILLYNPDKIKDINAINIDDRNITISDITAKLRELLSNGTLIGVALKQLKSMNGSFKINSYNLDTDKSGKVDLKNRLKDYKILPFVTPKGEVKNRVDIQLDTHEGMEYIITYRSFGGIYMDIHKKNGSALGKVPVALWRESVDDIEITGDLEKYFVGMFDDFKRKFGWKLQGIGETDLKFIPNKDSKDPNEVEALMYVKEKCIKLLTFLYEQGKQLHELLQSWMSGALAEGDQKFPFLLTEPK